MLVAWTRVARHPENCHDSPMTFLRPSALRSSPRPTTEERQQVLKNIQERRAQLMEQRRAISSELALMRRIEKHHQAALTEGA